MKILFLRFSSIGDVVITSTIVRCVRNKYPNAFLGFASKKAFSSLVQHNPHLNKVHLLDDSFDTLAQEIKAEEYTHVIDLHKNLRTKRLKPSIPKAQWYTYDKLNWQKWLLVRLRINKLPGTHIVDRYFEAIANLNVLYDGLGMDFYFPPSFTLKSSIALPISYTVFAIGGTYATKRLPMDKIKELASVITGPLVLIGGAEDWERSKHITGDKLVNLCGQLDLIESAHVVKQSNKVIAHDSGFMHIAAALNKPLLSIWGNTVPDFGFYPLLKEHAAPAMIIEKGSDLSCRPCSKLGYDACPKGHFKCMNHSTDEILKKLNALAE